MEQEQATHKGVKVFIFREDDQFDRAVQPECAVVGGNLIYRLPRVQDQNATFQDQIGHRVICLYTGRTTLL